MERRVVITAESSITPIGRTKKEIINNLLNGISGVKKITKENIAEYNLDCGVFGAVDYDIEYGFQRKYTKTMGPVSYVACQVSKEIIESSGLESKFITSGRLGVAFGSIHGSPTIQKKMYQTFSKGNYKGAATNIAIEYLKSMAHTTAVNITRMFGITGRVISSSTACTTSSQSIGYGYEAIKFGMQDAMICGGADEYDLTTVAVFDSLLACSTRYNSTPTETPRPFDKKRDGIVVGEGAGAVLLEEYEFAKKRGANILGEVIGFACNNNGGDIILPSVEGITNVIKQGLDNAKLNSKDVDFISAHATATKAGDACEAMAINKIYGSNSPLVSGLKSYIGHTMSACGVIELILTLYMIENGFIVPTLNLTEVDEQCSMIRHNKDFSSIKINAAAIQNFAFGGVNTIIFIKRFE